MRILVFTPFFPPSIGGLETLVAELVGELATRDHDVLVMASAAPGDLPKTDEWQGVPVRRVPLHAPLARNDVRRITATRRSIAAIKTAFAPEVVHVPLADASVLYHLLTAHDAPAPCVLTVHSSIAASEAR